MPKTVTRQRRDCDLNPGRSAPESSTLTTRLPSHCTRSSIGVIGLICSRRKTARRSCLPVAVAVHRQALQSCLVWCELSRPDKCVLRRSASGGRTAPPDTLRHRPDTERTCLAVNSHRHTRQDKTVLSVSCPAWRCELALMQHLLASKASYKMLVFLMIYFSTIPSDL